MSFAFRIRAICQEQQYATITQIREPAKICHFSINRRIVKLVVACVDNHAHRRTNGKPHCIRYAMIDTNKSDAEAADVDYISRRNGF